MVVGVWSADLVVWHALVVVARMAAVLCFCVLCWRELDARRRVAFFDRVKFGTVRDGNASRDRRFLRDL